MASCGWSARDAAGAEREHGERGVPHRRLARLRAQPLAVVDHEALPALHRLPDRRGPRTRARAPAARRSPQTHGGWIPPHDPSASCRSRIQRSATAWAWRRRRFGRPRRPRPAGPGADRAQVDVGVADRPQRLRDRERDERLPRPAGEVVDREGRRRRQQHELGRDRHHPLPRPLAEQGQEALREQAAPRDAALAPDVRERRGARVDAGQPARDVGLDRRREVGRPLVPDRPRTVVAHPGHQLVRDPAVELGVRRPRKWCQKRCCAVIVTFDSSSPTQIPSGRCSSSSRRVPRSIARVETRQLGGRGHAGTLPETVLRMC